MDERVSTRDLLEAWREATLAAELAERLAGAAVEAAEAAEESAGVAEEIAVLAEAAAAAADHAAAAARSAATKARAIASRSRSLDLQEAQGAADVAHEVETAARARYQRAVADAERRHNAYPSGRSADGVVNDRASGGPGALDAGPRASLSSDLMPGDMP